MKQKWKDKLNGYLLLIKYFLNIGVNNVVVKDKVVEIYGSFTDD